MAKEKGQIWHDEKTPNEKMAKKQPNEKWPNEKRLNKKWPNKKKCRIKNLAEFKNDQMKNWPKNDRTKQPKIRRK